MEYLYLDGCPVGAARCALCGCACHEDWPIRSPDCMPLAKATLQAYRRRSPDQSRDPPCEEMLWLIVDFLLRNQSDPVMYALAAAVALLAWDCYFRPQEALDLRASDDCAKSRGRARQDQAVRRGRRRRRVRAEVGRGCPEGARGPSAGLWIPVPCAEPREAGQDLRRVLSGAGLQGGPSRHAPWRALD
ncbi:unnamed protein product [Prorocentrum cordatum]|uniref:Uncharacterized protein n=1 Tax=Prorocentrum cordatum TaxID=2364126 RepID=A0ABN9XTW0_9DINO|nr:unnamed protein product [Polarella glacialis]